jgi:hypothetical protein
MIESKVLPVPYPADTRAKGWRFELDLEQIDQSDTWALTPLDMRPWLIMLWASAWRQTPCGSLPDDDGLIAVRIGMKTSVFTKHRETLLRGWWKAEDGRLYHDTISHRVTEMLAARDKERNRKAAYRKRTDADGQKTPEGVPGMSHGTTEGQQGDTQGMDNTSTSTRTSNSVPNGTDAAASPPTNPPPGLTAKDAVFHLAVPWLVERGVPDKNARSLLGGAIKQLGDEGALTLAQECMREGPLEPAAWIAGAINARMKPGGVRGNKQENLEARNRAVAARLAQEGS